MQTLPPILRDQRELDVNHVRLLAIFHFVGAGLALVGILFVLGHFAVFHSLISNPKIWEGQKQAPPPAEIFGILKWFYLAFGLWFATSLALNLISAFFLRARTHRTFSIVVAAINCLHIPLGTVLGVFTIVVLMRNSVKELYENPTDPLPEPQQPF